MTATMTDAMNPGPPTLTDRYADALAYALELHRDQVRKSTTIPYFSHLASVSALVVENGGDEDEAIAGLLHDAVEDQGGAPRLAEIRARFGDRVAEIVAGCTDTALDGSGPKEDWATRKNRYLDHLRAETDVGILRVSCADKLHNARAILQDHRRIGNRIFERFNAGREGTLWYYGELAGIFSGKSLGFLAEEFERVTRKLIASTTSEGERTS